MPEFTVLNSFCVIYYLKKQANPTNNLVILVRGGEVHRLRYLWGYPARYRTIDELYGRLIRPASPTPPPFLEGVGFTHHSIHISLIVYGTDYAGILDEMLQYISLNYLSNK